MASLETLKKGVRPLDKNIKDCIYMILENANNFKDLEEEIYQLVCLIVREKIKEILKEVDDVLK